MELLYTVPRDDQGSWVSLTVDPKGRLITSDQDGKLFRVTAAAARRARRPRSRSSRSRPKIGMAPGSLLWAFDGLYVMVNGNGRRENGLYRVRDTDGDDVCSTRSSSSSRRSKVEGGEHGPHGMRRFAPDGKSLYVVAGNATTLPALHDSLVPRVWGEDTLLPRMPDGRGFMHDEKAPGGFVCRVDPDGKQWELVSMGYRNACGLLAFQVPRRRRAVRWMRLDTEGGTSTRRGTALHAGVCDVGGAARATSSYRGGSGKFPVYAFDSLPPVLNVGPGIAERA